MNAVQHSANGRLRLRVWDTAGATARVAHHHMGLRGDRTVDDVDEVEAQIMAALGDPTYRRAVEHLRDLYATYESEERALAVIGSLLPTD